MNAAQMEARVLRGENAKLKQVIEHLKAQAEKEKAIENFMAHALGGFCSQPRAASETYWGKDDATGTLVPLEGGPRWAASQAILAMNYMMLELESALEQQAPPEAQAPGDSPELPECALFEAGKVPENGDSQGGNPPDTAGKLIAQGDGIT